MDWAGCTFPTSGKGDDLPLGGRSGDQAFLSLDGYDHLSEAVPVPGTGCIYMIHAVSGKGRVEECLLELDMDTGRCRIAALPGMGEDLKLRWFTEDWLLVQGNGEILSDDFAQLIHMPTREVLHIRPGMFGGEKLQHIGMLTDGTVVIVTRRNRVGPVFRYLPISGASCGRRANPVSWSPGGSTGSCTLIFPSSCWGRSRSRRRMAKTSVLLLMACCVLGSTNSLKRKNRY